MICIVLHSKLENGHSGHVSECMKRLLGAENISKHDEGGRGACVRCPVRGCVPSSAKYSVKAAWMRVETRTIRCTVLHLVILNTKRGSERPKSFDQVEQLKRVTV